MGEPKPAFLRRVKLRNYKSIRQCDVSLGRLTFLVGPNGSGKSNFLEALRFVSDSLRTTMQHAVEQRGEVRKIFWRGGKQDARQFSIDLWLGLPRGGDATYGITVGDEQGLFVIDEEHCSVKSGETPRAEFRVKRGRVVDATIPIPPPADVDELYLTKVSGYQDFSPMHKLLRGMGFYNIDPQQIRQEAESGQPARKLQRNGKGALFATQRVFHHPRLQDRMQEYLRAVLPTLERLDIQTTAYRPTPSGGAGLRSSAEGSHSSCLGREPRSLKFILATREARSSYPLPSVFGPHNMSDGTLRAFGVLLALFQCIDRPENDPIPLVGIEEPESTLHPAAVGVLFDALHEASHFTQVLVTTHSVELLDIKDLDPASLRVVDLVDGETIIGPADDASLSIMKDRMYTAGELLEMNQLRPNPKPSQAAVAGDEDSSSILPSDNE